MPIVEDGAAAVPADRKVVDDCVEPDAANLPRMRRILGAEALDAAATGLNTGGCGRATQANRRRQLPYPVRCVKLLKRIGRNFVGAVVSPTGDPTVASERATVLIADTDVDDCVRAACRGSELFVPL